MQARKTGEFYTPASIVNLIAELIEPYKGVDYDPCYGTGGMFLSSLKFVESHHGNRNQVSIVGQEADPDTWKLAKMNLAIRCISHNLGVKNASIFTDDQHKDKKVDFIMANPPFNLNLKSKGDTLYQPTLAGTTTAFQVKSTILHILNKLDLTNEIATSCLKTAL